MPLFTTIQWCDSTANLQMGCEGCELIKGKKKPTCYANALTKRWAGRKGWPVNFTTPKLFLERLPKILKMPDLTGTIREDKPWLNGLPRVIFLNDMGDTFSKGMPKDWFAEVLPALAASPHIYMLLTKWPKRMAAFAEKYPLPPNVWPGTSITSNKTAFRAAELYKINSGGRKWISMEPMWENVSEFRFASKELDLLIIGGESGPNAVPFIIDWAFGYIQYYQHFQNFNTKVFIKQFGSNVWQNSEQKLKFKDASAGNWDEWPENLKVRQFPQQLVMPSELLND